MNQMTNLSFSERTNLNRRLVPLYDSIRRDLMVMEFNKVDLSEKIMQSLKEIRRITDEA